MSNKLIIENLKKKFVEMAKEALNTLHTMRCVSLHVSRPNLI